MEQIKVLFKFVANPMERGWLTCKFQHPLHGTKYIGCYKRDMQTNREDVFRRFATNCGQTVDNFNFVEGEKS